MVCEGPDPPENTPYELTTPSTMDLMMNGHQTEDSDDENEHFGYEPLPQGPEGVPLENDSDAADNECAEAQPPLDLPAFEPIDTTLTREVWSNPRPSDPIEMNSERVQQVMSAMANFSLPPTSIPEWAQSVSEDQWKQTLRDQIDKIKSKT